MKKTPLYGLLLGLLALCLILAATAIDIEYFWGRTVDVPDVTKEQKILLKSERTSDTTNAKIRVTGEIDGRAVFSWFCDDQGQCGKQAQIGPGKIDLEVLDGDWYDNSLGVKYQPQSVLTGHLTIRYSLD